MMTLIPFYFLPALSLASNSKELEILSPAGHQGTSVETFVQSLLHKKDNWFLDADTGSVVFTQNLRINPSEFSPSELPKLRQLMETGLWLGKDGTRYDFRKVGMLAIDGKSGGLGAFFDFFFSSELSNLMTNPFDVKYPASPYQEGMSAGEFLDLLVSKVYGKQIFLDGESEKWVLEGDLNLPLHNLPGAFSMEVVSMVMEGIWTSPSGRQYDFRKTAIVFPEIGTPEERLKKRLSRKEVINEIYKSLRAETFKKQKHLLLTLNSTEEFKPASGDLLKRFGKIELIKPYERCSKALISGSDSRSNKSKDSE